MNFDSSGMYLAFNRLQKNAEEKGRDFAQDQGNFFLRLTKKLAWKLAPTKDTLLSLQATLKAAGKGLKRKPGVTEAQEIARRIRARGTFARRWYISKVEKSRTRIRIWISNTVTYADTPRLAVVAVESANIVGKSMGRKLGRLAENIMREFKN